MRFLRLFAGCILFFSALFPTSAFAASFGITPSVLETQVERGDTLYGFVSLVRANPKEDTYILVSVRGDETGAVALTSGERFLLPLGEYDVRYAFAIDTSKLEGIDRFEAGLEFLNEKPEAGNGATNQILGNVMKIDVAILNGETGTDQASQTTEEETISTADDPVEQTEESPTFWKMDVLFLLIAVAALCLSVFIWRRRQSRPSARARIFLVCAAVFLFSIFGWAYFSGRILIHRLEDTWNMNISLLRDGAYFLITSNGGPDTFISPSTGQSQEMDGRWTYTATFPDRVYVMPADAQTDELYEKRLFIFYESGIKPLESSDLPGLVSSVQENVIRSYAVFMGTDPEQNQPYWCLAETWESSEISCDFLERTVEGDIQAVWFSAAEPHLVVIQTTEAAYTYDVWRKTSEAFMESEQQEIEPVFENPRPLEASAQIAQFGIVHLDEEWILAPIGAEYYPFSPSLWLERVAIDAETFKISLIDTRTFLRRKVWDLKNDETLEYLQNGGVSTSP